MPFKEIRESMRYYPWIEGWIDWRNVLMFSRNAESAMKFSGHACKVSMIVCFSSFTFSCFDADQGVTRCSSSVLYTEKKKWGLIQGKYYRPWNWSQVIRELKTRNWWCRVANNIFSILKLPLRSTNNCPPNNKVNKFQI